MWEDFFQNVHFSKSSTPKGFRDLCHEYGINFSMQLIRIKIYHENVNI